MGNVIALTDSSGNVNTSYYTDAWGNVVTGSSTQNPYVNNGGLGYWQDTDLNLNYVRARWLNPATGTWLSKDPVSGEPGYSYANNSPTFVTDSTGRVPGPHDLETQLRTALGGDGGRAALDNKIRQVRAQLKMLQEGHRIPRPSLLVVEAVKYFVNNLTPSEQQMLDVIARSYGTIRSKDKTHDYYINGVRINHYQDSTAAQRLRENQLAISAQHKNDKPVDASPIDWGRTAGSFVKGLAMGVGTVVLVSLVGGLSPVAGTVLAVIAIGAAVVCTLGNMVKRVHEAQQAGRSNAEAYFEGIGAGAGSLLGITELVEGASGISVTTGRLLTSNERDDELAGGSSSLLLNAAAKPLSIFGAYIGTAGQAVREAGSVSVRAAYAKFSEAPHVSDVLGDVASINGPRGPLTVETKAAYVRDEAALRSVPRQRNPLAGALRKAVIGKEGTQLKDVYLVDLLDSQGKNVKDFYGFHDAPPNRIALTDSLTPTEKAETLLHEYTHKKLTEAVNRFMRTGNLTASQKRAAIQAFMGEKATFVNTLNEFIAEYAATGDFDVSLERATGPSYSRREISPGKFIDRTKELRAQFNTVTTLGRGAAAARAAIHGYRINESNDD